MSEHINEIERRQSDVHQTVLPEDSPSYHSDVFGSDCYSMPRWTFGKMFKQDDRTDLAAQTLAAANAAAAAAATAAAIIAAAAAVAVIAAAGVTQAAADTTAELKVATAAKTQVCAHT